LHDNNNPKGKGEPTPERIATEDPERATDEVDALAEAGVEATLRINTVAARLALGLASGAEVRAALDVDWSNPYIDTSRLTLQCMLAGRWDLLDGSPWHA
jgi:hypothetical protein